MSLRELYDLLASAIESGNWWPAEDDFEIMLGAILTQNTAWTNVLKALDNLDDAGVSAPEDFLTLEQDRLAELIRPAGYFNTKTGYVKNIATWFIDRADAARSLPTQELRQELLGIRGVGGETADDILLYVYQRPVFIYDAYGRRLLAAAGFGEYKTYDKAKTSIDPLVHAAEFTVDELAHFHGLIVEAGKIANSMGGWSVAYEHLLDGNFSAGAAP